MLYLMPPDSGVYTGWIAFREHMRAHPDDARACEAVKQRAIADGNVDGWRYYQAKTRFLVTMAEKLQQRS